MRAPDYITSSGPYQREERDMATSIAVSRADAQAALAEAQAKLAEFVSNIDDLKAVLAMTKPNEPAGLGTVVRFRKYDRRYTYAAIKVGLEWYLTQNPARPQDRKEPKKWSSLLDFVGERNWDTIEVLS